MGEHRGRNSGILWRNSDADASLSDEAFADLGDSNPSWLSSLLFEHGIEPLEIDQERKRNSPSNGHSAFEEESDMDALEESLVSGQPVIERSVNVTPSQNVHTPLSVSLKQEFLPPRPIPFPWKTPQTGHKNNSLVARLGLNISESGTSWTDSLATPNNGAAVSVLQPAEQEVDPCPLGAARALFSPGDNDGDDLSQEAHAFEITQEEDPAEAPPSKMDRPKRPQVDLVVKAAMPSPVTPLLAQPLADHRSSTPVCDTPKRKLQKTAPTALAFNEFSQISPAVMKSMCDAVDVNSNRREISAKTPKRWKTEPPSKLPQKRTLFSKLKPSKGFAYPTKKQIDESCPSKIFHLEKASTEIEHKLFDVSKSSLSRQTSNKSTEDTLETTKKTDLEECENLLQDLPENAFSQEYLIPESDAHKSIAKQGAEESSAKLKEVYANPHDYAELDCDAVGFLNSSWEADIPQNWNTQWEQEVIEGDCGSPLTADCPNHDQKINTETENYSIIHEGNEKILYDELQEKDLPHEEKGFGGFQIASGKNVTVSEEALVKARQSMDDLPHEVTGFGGFQTASGKNVTVSEETLVKARQSMDDLPHEVTGFGGFQTASGKNVTVSEEALAKARQSMDDLPHEVTGFGGFQTASGKNVTVSEEALVKARQSMDDLLHEEKGFGGFQTASGKNVTVSEEALVKARQSMDDLLHEEKGFGGFQTASGKNVTVSEEALVKARHSMDDLLHEEKGFGGFQTASGNSVTVSEEAPVIPKQRTEGLNNPSSSFPRSQTENSSPLMITNVCPDEDYPSDRCGSFAPLQCTLNVTGRSACTVPSEAAATESIDLDAFFEADFSQMEQHNTPHFKISQQVVKDRLKAQVRQTQRISAKRKRQDIQPRPGSLWRQRRSRKRISLKEEFCGERPRRQSRSQLKSFGVSPSVINITAASAENFVFDAVDFYGAQQASTNVEGVSLNDGATLLFDSQAQIGRDQFCNALFDMPGVQPSLVSRDWVYNHYKWIVWKLASYEVSYPQSHAKQCLTPENVLAQLKYRYDVEVDHSQRSALKKILERDAPSAQTMVLLVSDLSGDPPMLQLSDGWYSIRSAADVALLDLIKRQKIKIGDKIIVHGAEMLGNSEGCSPLEAPADTALKLSANSCRRTLWNARLGFCRDPQPRPLPLGSLLLGGGCVSCVDVVVTRIYPKQFLEKLPDGSTCMRNLREEEKMANMHAKERESKIDSLYAKMQTEFEEKQREFERNERSAGSTVYSQEQVERLRSSSDIYTAYCSAKNSDHFKSMLSEGQLSVLSEAKREKMMNLQAQFQSEIKNLMTEQMPDRPVMPLVKLRIAGYSVSDIDSQTTACFSIWRPTDSLLSTLSEGTRLRIYSLSVAASRGVWSRTCRLSLTALRSTRYDVRQSDDDLMQEMVYSPRELSTFAELREQNYRSSYDEVDIVGMVTKITDSERAIHLADESGAEVKIVFPQRLTTLCLSSLVVLRQWLFFSSLLLSGRSSSPSLLFTELSDVSGNPRRTDAKIALENIQLRQQNSSSSTECRALSPTCNSSPALRKQQLLQRQKLQIFEKFSGDSAHPVVDSPVSTSARIKFRPPSRRSLGMRKSVPPPKEEEEEEEEEVMPESVERKRKRKDCETTPSAKKISL